MEIKGVEFTGVLNREQIAEELLTANLFVLPSFREPFGVSYIEAMSFHTPCIGTNIEAVPEIIDDGVTGYIVPPGDVNSLMEKMQSILPSERARDGLP
jgi:glycosyltransferase involved in cell wall biosynthesis